MLHIALLILKKDIDRNAFTAVQVCFVFDIFFIRAYLCLFKIHCNAIHKQCKTTVFNISVLSGISYSTVLLPS